MAIKMTPEEQDAYDKALRKIEACRRQYGTFLNLSLMGLTSLPPEIGRLSSLTKLLLQDNLLTSLPPELSQVSPLSVLWLYNNQLTSLPPELRNLSRLKHLFLHGNSALRLPPEVLGPTEREVFHQGAPPGSPQAILDYYLTPPASEAPIPVNLPVATVDDVFVDPNPPSPLVPLLPTGYDVFISAKSQDYAHARVAVEYLTKSGLRVFFSEADLPRMGAADYYAAIDDALETATHMLVVTSSREFANSQWVRKEWQTFLNEKLGGRKHGVLVTLLCGGLTIEKLPLSLRQFEARPQHDLAGLLPYFRR